MCEVTGDAAEMGALLKWGQRELTAAERLEVLSVLDRELGRRFVRRGGGHDGGQDDRRHRQFVELLFAR